MRQELSDSNEKGAALLRVASYFGRPQKFMAVGDARANMRSTLELVPNGSVVLTMHGQPEAAVVPFTTLEDMRRALLHLLVEEIGSSFALSRQRLRPQRKEVPWFSEEELETLVGEALRKER